MRCARQTILRHLGPDHAFHQSWQHNTSPTFGFMITLPQQKWPLEFLSPCQWHLLQRRTLLEKVHQNQPQTFQGRHWSKFCSSCYKCANQYHHLTDFCSTSDTATMEATACNIPDPCCPKERTSRPYTHTMGVSTDSTTHMGVKPTELHLLWSHCQCTGIHPHQGISVHCFWWFR